MEILFLGSGGGRWTTITQRLKTGGFRVHGAQSLHIDPGPGALLGLNENSIFPTDLDALVVTHCHPDHYNDAEVLIEAMTQGMSRRRGTVAGSESVFTERNGIGPAVSRYHRTKVEEILSLLPGKRVTIAGLETEVLPTRHSDPTGVGVKFLTEFGPLTYTSDTEYFEGLSDSYAGSRLVIYNVLRPGEERIPWHLCVDDVIRLIEEASPEVAILNHFGIKMIDRRRREAERVEAETGIKTLPAFDGLRIALTEEGIFRENGRREGRRREDPLKLLP
jgi:phosphoribosyl 1,2-cyclic phosphodiesterase